MNKEGQHRSDKGRKLMPPIFSWLPACMYLGVVGIYIYYTLTGFYRFSLPWAGGMVLIAGILVMVGLDRLEHRYQAQGREPSRLAAAILQFSRTVVIVVFSYSDGLGIIHSAVILPVIFFTFFYLCGRSYGLTGLVWMLYLIARIHIIANGYSDFTWSDKSDDMTRDFIFTLILAFILIMAYQAKRERASRQRVEKLLGELELSHRKLQDYAEKVAELVTMEERNRLARDIHDSLGHYLTVINVQLEKAMAYRDINPQVADQAVSDAKRIAGEALQDVRRSVGTLRSTREPFSLIQALTELVNNLRISQLFIELEIDGCEKGFSQQSLMTLYRAAQEGLTNIQKYAQANHVTMSLKFNDQQAGLCVIDNGHGFDTSILLDKEGPHYGLQGLRERLELVRGSIELESASGKGTKLCVTVPRNPLTLVSGERRFI